VGKAQRRATGLMEQSRCRFYERIFAANVQRTVHMHGRQTTRAWPAMLDLIVIDYHYLTLPVCVCMVYLKGMKSSAACWSWSRCPTPGCGDPVEVDLVQRPGQETQYVRA